MAITSKVSLARDEKYIYSIKKVSNQKSNHCSFEVTIQGVMEIFRVQHINFVVNVKDIEFPSSILGNSLFLSK